MNKAEQVLKRLEWSARYSYCTGWPCCPICKGIKPGHGKDENGVPPDNSGHRDNCELVAALTPNAKVTGVPALSARPVGRIVVRQRTKGNDE